VKKSFYRAFYERSRDRKTKRTLAHVRCSVSCTTDPADLRNPQGLAYAVYRLNAFGILSTRASPARRPRCTLVSVTLSTCASDVAVPIVASCRRQKVNQRPVHVQPREAAHPRFRFLSLTQSPVPASAHVLLAAPPRKWPGRAAPGPFLGLAFVL